MRLATALAIVLVATPCVAAKRDRPQQQHCRLPSVQLAAAAPRASFKRLGDLPPADAVMLVDRVVDGCPAPLIVRTGIGNQAKAPEQPSASH